MIVLRIYETIARDGQRVTRCGMTTDGVPVMSWTGPREDVLATATREVDRALDGPHPPVIDELRVLREAVEHVREAAILHGVNDEVGAAIAYVDTIAKRRSPDAG